jgi:hypothetical protein
MPSAPRAVRRAWHHLTRSQAKAGWALTAVSIATYAAIPANSTLGDPARQFFLVVASVAIGAVFLPELSNNLWSIKPEEVKGLIPADKIKSLESSIVQSQINDPEWSDVVIDSALQPLIAANNTPERILGDLQYHASIHLDRKTEVNGLSIRAHRVETNLRARRILPPSNADGLYWVSIARDQATLHAEYEQTGCLLREIVEFDPAWDDEQWRAAVESMSSARMNIGGTTRDAVLVPADTVAPPEVPGLVRWFFNAKELPAGAPNTRRTIGIAFDFPMCDDYFSVILKSYYAIGSTNIVVRIYGDTDQHIEWIPFFGRALGKGDVDVEYNNKNELCQQITAASSDDTLVWPGSGMLVWWGGPTPTARPTT